MSLFDGTAIFVERKFPFERNRSMVSDREEETDEKASTFSEGCCRRGPKKGGPFRLHPFVSGSGLNFSLSPGILIIGE